MQPNARRTASLEWQVLPMLNPDGVIIGNYRCNLGGVDLNREWQQPSAAVSPEILAVKELFRLTCQVWPLHWPHPTRVHARMDTSGRGLRLRNGHT